MRRNQFTVDAESIQGEAGATVTFKALKVREVREYTADPAQNDTTLLHNHVLSWKGIVDDDGKELPSESDDPEVTLDDLRDAMTGELYLHERVEMVTLLFQGPDGLKAKN